MCIDFIRDDWDFVTAGDGQNVKDMLFGVDRSAGVGRTVDDDASRVLVKQRLQVIKVNLP